MKAKQEFNTDGKAVVKPFLRRSKDVFGYRKIITIVFILLASALVISCKKNAKDADSEVVAHVGSREITMRQVDSVIKQQVDSSGGAAFSPAELVMARLTVLDNLIQEEALYQRAQRQNLVPDENKVAQEIQRRKQEARFTEEQYQNQLKQAGITEEEYRERVRRELAIAALRDQERAKVTPPTEEEIKKYYEDRKEEYRAERGVDISMIAVSPQNNGGPAGADQKIKDIYNRLKAGSDFATIASQESEDQASALRGGRLGFASEAGLRQIFPTRPELQSRLMGMTRGQYTEPIQDQGSGAWYIILVNDKLEQSRNLTFEDVRQNIVDTLTQQRQQVLLNALVMLAVAEADVKNHLAERIVENPKMIVDVRPSALLQTNTQSAQPAQPQPRFENQNQASPQTNANSSATSTNTSRPQTNSAGRAPASNTNR